MQPWSAAVLGISLVAALWDARTRTIPRWLTLPALGLGLTYHAVAGGLLSSLSAAGVGLGLGLLLMALGAFGGGDAKWLAALGALLGLSAWLWALAFSLFAAAAWALIQLAYRSRLVMLPADLLAIVRGWRDHGLRPHPDHNLLTPGAVTAPFGVAMGIGVLCVLVL